jgi:hypothetical protein
MAPGYTDALDGVGWSNDLLPRVRNGNEVQREDLNRAEDSTIFAVPYATGWSNLHLRRPSRVQQLRA